MLFLKSLADGVGTAAGVAWPLFGMISGSLSLFTGGIATIIFGSISCGLFVLVALPVAIWSYSNYRAEHKAMRKKLHEEETKFYQQWLKYLSAMLENVMKKKSIDKDNVDDLVNTMILQIQKHQNTSSPTLSSLLADIQNNKTGLIKFVSTMIKEKEISSDDDKEVIPSTLLKDNKQKSWLIDNHIKNICDHALHTIKPSPTFNVSCVTLSVTAFFAGFGTVLGCSAGVTGLLTGMGVIAGLSAVPVVGWAALGTAIVIGVVIATTVAHDTFKKNKLNQTIAHYQRINADLSSQNIRLDEKLKYKIKIEKKVESKNEKVMRWHKDFKHSPISINNTFIKQPTSKLNIPHTKNYLSITNNHVQSHSY